MLIAIDLVYRLESEALAELLDAGHRGGRCPACGMAKSAEAAFCLGCFESVPGHLKWRLERAVDGVYRAAVLESFRRIGNNYFHAPPDFEMK